MSALLSKAAMKRTLSEVRDGPCVTSMAGPNGLRNCTKDEGGPLGFGNQVLISSRRKLLRRSPEPDCLRRSNLPDIQETASLARHPCLQQSASSDPTQITRES
jgi:hypothetical protein